MKTHRPDVRIVKNGPAGGATGAGSPNSRRRADHPADRATAIRRQADDNLERRTAEYVEMLRQIQGSAAGGAGPAAMELTTGGDPHEQAAFLAALDRLAAECGAGKAPAEESPAAARAALVSADQLLATASGILDGLAFGEAEVEGHPAAVVLEAARLDLAAGRRCAKGI